MNNRMLVSALLASSALGVVAVGPAFAQNAASAANNGALEEIVVTATRQASTVNRVPLSIQAVTQNNLDQQGIKSAADLTRTIPALTSSQSFGGTQTYAIRGVVQGTGAATTGVYLDDVALQKRSLTSGHSGNGTPAPPLFDLERVEVLRGPQGTLYGGSSEGGTIRFITPQPSLTRYSGYFRSELSTIMAPDANKSDPSYEAGVAFGGPIVQDKLGFRASIFAQHNGGYVDVLDPYNNGAVRWEHANSSNAKVGRLALAWAPAVGTLATLSLYHSDLKEKGGPNNWALPVGNGTQTFTTTSPCYDTRRVRGGSPSPTATVACPANAVEGRTINGIYKRPAATYGPFPYLNDPYKSIVRVLDPAHSELNIASLTLDQEAGIFDIKAITSYIHDIDDKRGNAANVEFANTQYTTDLPGARGFSLSSFLPDFGGIIRSKNTRRGFSEEIRVSTNNPESRRLSVVTGLYYSNIITHSHWEQIRSTDQYASYLYGNTGANIYGAPYNNLFALSRDQLAKDKEFAGFGEANFRLTERLKLIGGVRLSRVSFGFDQVYFGSLAGYNDPFDDPRGVTRGHVTEKPVTPKFGAQYQLTDNDMVYVSGAKGYRAGGVNVPLSIANCAAPLAAAGLTIADIPLTYNSDSVWSYEAGGKFRLFNGRMQINSSVFQINWNDTQQTVNVSSSCPNGWVTNVGKATSKGFDADAQARLWGGLSANFAIGYNKAEYAQDVFGPKPLNGAAATQVLRKGDPLPVPKWQFSVGARWDFDIAKFQSYIRGDLTYSGEYQQGRGPGLGAYAPDTYIQPSITRVNLRVGVNVHDWDVNAFVNNLFNSDDLNSRSGGRSGCAIAQGAACTTFTGLERFPTVSYGRPRSVGLQVARRF
jgi:outer membrane receptor protein involved in Fe transport